MSSGVPFGGRAAPLEVDVDLINELTKQTKQSKGKKSSGGGDIFSQLSNFSTLIGPLMALLGNGGLESLLAKMKELGLGDKVDSWIGKGPNKSITPKQTEKVLGKEKVQQLAAQTGMPENQVLQGLSRVLPGVVNHLTPDGSLPIGGEIESAIGGLLGAFTK
jgi:uncharacterized protein YidB (DUF937 family)